MSVKDKFPLSYPQTDYNNIGQWPHLGVKLNLFHSCGCGSFTTSGTCSEPWPNMHRTARLHTETYTYFLANLGALFSYYEMIIPNYSLSV